MNTASSLEEYRREHSFTREKFIEQIKMMHNVSVELNEKPRLKIDKLEERSDDALTKAHKFYWDML